MRKFNGFEAKKATARENLPAGGYVAKILNAEEKQYDWGCVTIISFDILDGPYKDFFAKDYKEQDREDKKWRGTYRLNQPKDDGSEKDGWTKRSFNNAIWAIESSNPGYHFDWDESKFVGKSVGVLFRNREWEYNGRTGWNTECCSLTSVEDIQSGNFNIPKDKPLNKAASSVQFEVVPNDDLDLPF